MPFRFVFRAFLSATSLLALAVPAHAEWREAKSKHFIVYGDMSEADLSQRTKKLERFDAALRSLFKVETDDLATVYYVSSMGEVEKLAGRANVGGFYRPGAQGAIAVVPERMGYTPNLKGVVTTPERILYHEYTHHMLLSNMNKVFPSWTTEGLAELFMTIQFDDEGSAIIGAPAADRGFAMAGSNHWTVRRLLEADVKPPAKEERIELYTRGWLLCHYLLISGKRPGQFFQYIDAVNAGTSPIKAGEQVFGDLDALERELNRYVRQGKFPSSKLTADKLKAPDATSVRTLTPGQAAILPYRLVSANGVTDKTAGPLAAQARVVANKYPDEPFVQRAMAEIEYDAKNYAAAEAAADRALAIDPKNIDAMVYKGRIAARRAMESKDPNGWRDARRWFLQANRLDPNYALPFALFYDTFVAAGQTPPESAITGIKRAVVLVPSDPTLRARASIAALNAGDLKLFRTVLAPIAFGAHASPNNPFAKLIAAYDSGSDKAALVELAKKLKVYQTNEFTDPNPDQNAAEKA